MCPQTASDPTLRVAMETAVTGYLQWKQANWESVNKCPQSGCNGHGSCAPPAEQCTCVPMPSSPSCHSSPFIGRMCSAGGTSTGTRGLNLTLNGPSGSGTMPLPSIPCTNGATTFISLECITDSVGHIKIKLPLTASTCNDSSWSTTSVKGATSTCHTRNDDGQSITASCVLN